MTIIARFTTVEGLIAALIKRRHSLGMSQLVLDDISGLQNGYTGKIEKGIKGLGAVSLPLVLGGLGCELALMPGPTQHRDESAESLRRQRSHWGRVGRQRQVAMQSPRDRKKIASAAAKARWRKVEG